MLGTSERCGMCPAPEVISVRGEGVGVFILQFPLSLTERAPRRTNILDLSACSAGNLDVCNRCHWHVIVELIGQDKDVVCYTLLWKHLISYPGHRVSVMRNSAPLKEQYLLPESFFMYPLVLLI